MSLAQINTQIDDLRAQAARIQSRWARASDHLDSDDTLTAIGKQEKRDAERDRARAQTAALFRQEKELVAAKNQALEKRLFGLTSLTSDPGQIIAYRDAQDRAARLTDAGAAAEVFASALRSDDKTLAAAVLARAVDSGWDRIVAGYVEHNPSAGEDLADLAQLAKYDEFEAALSYAVL